jgi:nitroimidazol reductase NimA-like FMN-containing flavoprotein (pyridoxamine 5'-phosphate oxidase superfamily)/MOSC domain-containing protein YiiM
MAREYLNVPPTTMRRSDRAVEDDAWIKYFLHHASVGTLATVHNGQPFVNTNLFVYDEQSHSIIIHTADKGRTRANVDNENRVCFTIMEMGRLLPDKEALEFSVEYGGVIIFGKSEIVEDLEEATRLLQLLLDKYSPHLTAGIDYRPPVPEELKRTSVFRVQIEEMSAKKKEVGAFPGAFWYPEQPVLTSVRTRPTWQGVLQTIHVGAEKYQPMTAVAEVELVAGKGIVGDRYFGVVNEQEATNITLIAQEDLDAVQQEYGFPITADQTRRNLLTVGVPLSHLVGKRFRIGEVVLEGTEICEPCKGLAEFSGYGNPIISAMLHRAGLRANIIKGGVIHAGDTIAPIISPEVVAATTETEA